MPSFSEISFFTLRGLKGIVADRKEEEHMEVNPLLVGPSPERAHVKSLTIHWQEWIGKNSQFTGIFILWSVMLKFYLRNPFPLVFFPPNFAFSICVF